MQKVICISVNQYAHVLASCEKLIKELQEMKQVLTGCTETQKNIKKGEK